MERLRPLQTTDIMRPILSVRMWAALTGLLLLVTSTAAQTFTGVNAPGGFADFNFEVDATMTNLSVTVPGAVDGYSYLFLKRDGPPSDANYDFASALTGQANAIHLELPELAAGTYFARVQTPASAPSHSFSLKVETNVSDMRSLARPVSKPVGAQWTGAISANGRQYFRFDLATNTPFRLSLDSANIPPDLYIQRGQVPTESSSWKRSLNVANDTLVAIENESLPGGYFVGVFVNSSAPPNAPFAMRLEANPIQSLAWDPGTTPEGTLVSSNYSALAGEHYFKVVTANPSVGAWRTALRVLEGEAAVYLSRGNLPAATQSDFKSEKIGSDGFVLSSAQFAPNELWYILVRTAPSTRWTLVTGTPYVQDLGTVAADSPGSGDVAIGPEGIRFFSARVPAGLLAWRVWLNGATNSLLFKKTSVPLPTGNELSQAGQALVVSPYLASGQKYFIGVPGQPDTQIRLDSRAQPILDLPYGSGAVTNVSGFPYTTYKVQVPAAQIAWQITLPTSSGNPNLAVRRSTVPNENNNDAFSDQSGSIPDNISLVPPVLSDGTFYITVWGSGAHEFTLQSGPANITETKYLDSVVNDDPGRAGWRYYRVANIAQQLGSLGWQLDVANAAPGTRLAIRRNAAPGLWTQRNPAPSVASYLDIISSGSLLQQPGHQADVWYIGVYNPTNVLGNFTLTTREIETVPGEVGTGSYVREGRPPGVWDFFRLELPAGVSIGGGIGGGGGGGSTSYLLGWDLRLLDVVGNPMLVVRRDALPDSTQTTFGLPLNATNWPSRAQWAAGGDWTGRPLPPTGSTNENGRVLTLPVGRPLESGTYYLGVINNPAYPIPTSFRLQARRIGPGMEIPVDTMPISGGRATGAVDPREAAYYAIQVPEGKRSLRFRLTVTSGEAMMVVSKDALPNVTANSSAPVPGSAGRTVQKVGDEYFTLLPPRDTNVLSAGTYYVAVVGEGQVPSEGGRVGLGQSSYVIETLGEMPEVDLGPLSPLGPESVSVTGSLAGGEVLAYHFEPDTNVLGFWISLGDVVGNPMAVSRGERDLADPSLGPTPDNYGSDGGRTDVAIGGQLLTVGDPHAIETIMVKARQGTPAGTYPSASYTLRVDTIRPTPLDFDGGSVTITDQDPARGGYFVVDVPTNALGWDLRLTGVTSGKPQIVVSRDTLPVDLVTTGGFSGATRTNWDTAERWAATRDWTERAQNSDGVSEEGRVLMMGMGRPLEPGRYYIGVLGATLTNRISYTLTSRGIGPDFTIPVTALDFEGGSHSITGLPPREAAYFKVEIPTNTPSWKVHLAAVIGDGLLAVGKDALPNVLVGGSSSLLNSTGRKAQKLGDEHFLLLPPTGTNVLVAGTYYLAVVSEGVGPQPNRVGSGTSDFTILSQGPAPIRDLGQIGAADLTELGVLTAGDSQLYRFRVPVGTLGMEVRLDSRTGNPVMVLKGGEVFPIPGAGQGSVPSEIYGFDGGSQGGSDVHSAFLNIGNPTNVYSMVVMARSTNGAGPTNATYTLRLNASGSGTLPFDGEAIAVANQPPQSWRYFRVVVPEETMGWDVRLRDVTGGLPRLVIRRESLPSNLQTAPWSTPSSQTAWPTNAQWAPGPDWTRRSASAADAGISEDGRIFACGMGRPLQAGTYYVGVYNNSTTAKTSYNLLSRGIGDGFSIPLVDVPLVGSAEGTLPAREAAYFRVVVPTNTLSWKVRLTGTSGESMMVALRGFVPSIDMNVPTASLANGKGMQKLGNDHFLLLPGANQPFVTSGTNYFAVAGEGVNPPAATRIGTGSSSFVFESQGVVAPEDLGLLTSEDIFQPGSVEGGESRVYQFQVPVGMIGFRVKLEDRVGNPTLVLRQGEKLPDPGAPAPSPDTYGNEGGLPSTDGHTTLVSVPNPVPGVYTLVVKGRSVNGAYPDASFTLHLQEMLTPEINFDEAMNAANGLSHSVSGVLDDNERVYFKFVIPSSTEDEPVVGWQLKLVQSSGLASMRARLNALPSDATAPGQMPFTTAQAILVPPFLTNGVWYVEVKGAGSTAFTLSSQSLDLERAAWRMPGVGQPVTTLGVSAPLFGDTGVDAKGVPLPGDQSTFLQQGFLHYYAIEVPDSNQGLLRAALEAFSGNPDLYLRYGAPPTLYHNATGGTGSIFDRSMLANATEYANWVPLAGKTETKLKGGLWYIAVRASGNANARYRLKLSIGNVTDINQNGTELSNQLVAGGDWRYYRFTAPPSVPGGVSLTFSQQSGDVVVYVRDTVPPGNGASAAPADLKDWNTDAKNHGPYLSFDAPGTYSLTAPPLRPGAIYYIGVRAVSDASFSIRLTTNAVPNVMPEGIAFYGGRIDPVLPPGSQSVYRIDVPAEATRWLHKATNVAGVQMFLEQGTLPAKGGTDDWRNGTSTNSNFNQYLMSGWPWVPGQPYFLVVTNGTTEPQQILFAMDGKNGVSDDNDKDELADAWELLYFGNTGSQLANGDPDQDKVNNIEEYLEGTRPNDAASFRARLLLASTNGTIEPTPQIASYVLGSSVTLVGAPNPGFAFVSWTGDLTGRVNPITIQMDGHRTIGAIFKRSGDEYITALPLVGPSATAVASNVSMTKEPGEPNHAGNPGGKSIWWMWTAPASGSVKLTTAGSPFNTLLAVYTGSNVAALTHVASDANSGGPTGRSLLHFNATAGTTYSIAVDGLNGASSRINLGLTMEGVVVNPSTAPPEIQSIARFSQGRVEVEFVAEPDRVYTLEATENLTIWQAVGTVRTDATGNALFIDADASPLRQRFYRAKE